MVNVANQLLNAERKEEFSNTIKAEYTQLQEQYAQRKPKQSALSLHQARDNQVAIDWASYQPTTPQFIGTKVIDSVDVATLIPYIDWTPFFRSWQLAGHFPELLEDKIIGDTARSLYADAEAMLSTLVRDKIIQPRGIIGLYPAAAHGDDVVVYSDESRSTPLERFHFIRQQMSKSSGKFNQCLSDYIAPQHCDCKSYIGFFAVTTGLGLDKQLKTYSESGDTYNDILLKAIADRLVEAFAEYLHQQVRTTYWGYNPNESINNDALIKEQYRGIRPAPGYPACPDHSEKYKIFKLMNVTERINMVLTESAAMFPASSVSGYYFAHPEARYFGVGKIGNDQVKDYAERKQQSIKDTEKWLATLLNYTPDTV